MNYNLYMYRNGGVVRIMLIVIEVHIEISSCNVHVLYYGTM